MSNKPRLLTFPNVLPTMASLPSRPPRRQPRSIPPFLRLPLEIREAIYSYLLPRENVSHPLPSVGITSVNHRPPTSSLLNIHPQITSEILSYFYAIATWKLVFSHAFNFFRIDPDLRKLEQSPSLSHIRKVEVVFFCDVLLLKSYPSFGVESFCAEIERRASRACDVLRKAERLNTVIVSWCDSTDTGHWEQKAKILAPLRKLSEEEGRRRTVHFRIGDITGPKDMDRATFVEALQEVLGTSDGLRRSLDGANDDVDDPSSKYRMLAFDVRQERHRLAGQPGGIPRMGRDRTGWGGAPPSLEAPAEEAEDLAALS
ncbi:unnamed protein product [Zymoseptoria tritici ST99CH_1A5]|uniref:Uncharacterized protein n=1 Tax=Zymoseptoria tritici ST99CH_1A5 TaxID=1276529 RepID=A0A1Y6LA48_ZYMTR|nr:unnamed protein product [Zymoseptoria tritici ST99CH_3D1]SMY20479.1 unnamed protein product [Zymoseptoria tritici ST99CH_1A5]